MAPLGWKDLVGARVGIYGAGVEGTANFLKCGHLGISPVVVDDRPLPDFEKRYGVEVLKTDSGGLDALRGCDVVVKAPGISLYAPAIVALDEAGVRVLGGLALWFHEAPAERVLCVTGTKGKSTTTNLAGHLLRAAGFKTFVGGNLGVLPYDPSVGADFDYWAVEVASFQTPHFEIAPPVVAVTSLGEDHLPWHQGDPELYYRNKLSICRRPGACVTVANGDSTVLREHRGLLGPDVDWVTTGDFEPWLDQLSVPGRHNKRNALIAATALRHMGIDAASDSEFLREAATTYVGLESRLCVVDTFDGVTFVDDSLATNTVATLAAVESFPGRRIALLVGGQSRGIDYSPLAAGLRTRDDGELLIVTMPDNGAEIADAIAKLDAGSPVRVEAAEDLHHAVSIGFSWARPDGVVLLSPAAASFGHFANYRERSAAFRAAVSMCRTGTSA